MPLSMIALSCPDTILLAFTNHSEFFTTILPLTELDIIAACIQELNIEDAIPADAEPLIDLYDRAKIAINSALRESPLPKG